jgi:acyl dehydratase
MSLDQVEQFVGKESGVVRALDTVSTSDIRHWRELMEGKKESWNTDVAPPSMTLAWAMDPLWPKRLEATEPHEQVLRLLDDAGYGVTVGIALDQEYLKPVRLGDRLSYKVKVAGVSSAEEDTKYGKGYKVNLLYTFTNQEGEVVSRQSYTILKSRILNPVA